MPAMNVRDPYEFESDTYGGVPGMLRRFVQQREAEPGSNASAGPGYNSDSTQGGLLGRLLALHAEQSQYRPVPENSGSSPFVSPNPDFRQVSRVPNYAPPAMPGSPAPQAWVPQTQAQDEADQAQQARDAAAARLVRGARSLARAEAPPPDPVDIAKSAGIGVARGAIGVAGAIPQVSDWAHRTVNKGLDTVFNAITGPPRPSPPPPNINAGFSPENITKFIEGFTGKFYQPASGAGRYAETIGEMLPAALSPGVALRDLGPKLVTDAVLPGMAVQALEGAFPDSSAGQWLQKAWPWVRRGVPLAPLALGTVRRTFRALDSR